MAKRPAFQKSADELSKLEESAIPKQIDSLLEFTARAYRRPLSEIDRSDLLKLYATIRAGELGHEDAFRSVLTRVLVSPAFLFRIEQAPDGKERRPVNDWELATRLSYFLWSSAPDDELRKLAAAGQTERSKGPLPIKSDVCFKDERLRCAWPSSLGRSGFTSKVRRIQREETSRYSRLSTQNFERSSMKNPFCSSRILFQSDRAVSTDSWR